MGNKRTEEAVRKFRSGSNCAQAVLSTYLPTLGVPEAIAHKMGTGLGAGVGRKQYLCGALNGGSIVLSAHFGNETSEDTISKDSTSLRVRTLVERFEEKFTSAQCLDIIGIDITTDEGRKKASETNVFRNTCDGCVESVCNWLEEELSVSS